MRSVPADHKQVTFYSSPPFWFTELQSILNSFLFTCLRNRPNVVSMPLLYFTSTDARFQNHFYCASLVHFVYTKVGYKTFLWIKYFFIDFNGRKKKLVPGYKIIWLEEKKLSHTLCILFITQLFPQSCNVWIYAQSWD